MQTVTDNAVQFSTTFDSNMLSSVLLPSVLWHCWLGITKNIRPFCCWHGGYLSGVRCK